METLFVERLDHLGVVAGVINDLGIRTMIDARIPPDKREEITTGEAVAGMILNGLGFFSRPLSLTPQFFEKKPLDLLFREGVFFGHFNRFKLGRSLDKIYAYGCNLLFSEISLAVCQKEGVDLRFNSLDTTSFSLSGEYDSSTDEEAILVTYGYSKDHRPDLKQVILELMVSQDGGVPFLSQSWNGNANDNQIFLLRSVALIEEFKASPTPRYLVADAKLYTEENAKNLALFPFITRIPGTLAIEQQVINQGWSIDSWQPIDATYSYQRLWLCHYGIEQRWLIIYSKAAEKRAEKTLEKSVDKEFSSVSTPTTKRLMAKTTKKAGEKTVFLSFAS